MDTTSSLKLLGKDLAGEVIEPSGQGFDEHKESFYGEFNARHPLAVARVANASDVSKVVSFARDSGIDLVVRGGGHSLLGHSSSDGGLVLDLSALKSLDIDAAGGSAWAGGGLLAGDYTAAVAKHGLITGFGDTPSVGIAGLTLGGGVGFLHRKLGLTIDSLLGAEIVTADGEIRRIDDKNEPDLFWAIRGGGGNFGVVTSLHYRLHPLDTVLGGMLILPGSPRVIADLVSISQGASDDMTAIVGFAKAPPLPFLPEEVHGQLIAMVLLVHAGNADVAETEVGRLRNLAIPIIDGVEAMRFADIYNAEAGPPQPEALSGRSFFSDVFGRDEAEAAIEAVQAGTAPMNVVQVRVLGGAVSRVPADATAFAHRDRAMVVNVAAAYENPADRPEHEAWVEAVRDKIEVGTQAAYANLHGDDSEAAVREIYPGSVYDRLVDVKTKYDQSNLFSSNHNIPPRS